MASKNRSRAQLCGIGVDHSLLWNISSRGKIGSPHILGVISNNNTVKLANLIMVSSTLLKHLVATQSLAHYLFYRFFSRIFVVAVAASKLPNLASCWVGQPATKSSYYYKLGPQSDRCFATKMETIIEENGMKGALDETRTWLQLDYVREADYFATT